MSKKEEALKLALEALKTIDEAMPFPVAKLAQKAIGEVLAQPEQKPVAWVYPEGLEALKANRPWTAYGTRQEPNNTALYLSPQPAQQQEPVKYDCCGNCMRPQHEHNGNSCPKPYTTVWHAWDYDFSPYPAPAVNPSQQAIHCKHRRENSGVCPHHNLQCGWPKCNEPEQEPVAWMAERNGKYYAVDETDWGSFPVYTTPPQRKPLTDEQREQIYNEWCSKRDEVSYDDLMLAVEAAHGIKRDAS